MSLSRRLARCALFRPHTSGSACRAEREFFIDNLLVRIHLIIEMIVILAPQPAAQASPDVGVASFGEVPRNILS